MICDQISLLIQTRTLFTEEELLWISFSFCLLQMLTDGLWIIVMLLSDSHSDGTHSLQRISPNLMKKQTPPNLKLDVVLCEEYLMHVTHM